ncbi:hypothetical protein C0991_002909, partial [Blastosporella zonata]
MLTMFLQPGHPRHVVYMRSHSLEAVTAQLISKIYLDIGLSATSLKWQKQIKAVVATFEHILHLSGHVASAELDFLGIILAAAKTDDSSQRRCSSPRPLPAAEA